MKALTFGIIISVLMGTGARASELVCRGNAFISEFGVDVNLLVTLHPAKDAIFLYDISDDTEPWWPMKVVENRQVGNRDHIHAVLDSKNAPPYLDPAKYDIEYEVDQTLGFPTKFYAFRGKIGGMEVPSTDLTCKFE